MNRTALVLAAHGSNTDPSVNEQMLKLADQIRFKALFDVVCPAFHQGCPAFSEVLDLNDANEFTVVPVMTSEGFYAQEVLPRELRRNRRYCSVTVRQTPALGTHPGIVDLAFDRISCVLAAQDLSSSKTALIVVGHGTGRNPQSRSTTQALAEALKVRGPCLGASCAFLDDDPSVEEALKSTAHPYVIILPFMIHEGPHVRRDLHRRLGMAVAGGLPPYRTAIGGRTLICDAALGTNPGIVEIIAALALGKPKPSGCKENLKVEDLLTPKSVADFNEEPARLIPRPARPAPVRLGTRGSVLARWQANHVADRLRSDGVTVEIIEITTSGDRSPGVPIADLPSVSPFTDDLDRALMAGQIDLAVHSLKDLPLDLPASLSIAAVLPRGDPTECLVSSGSVPLSALPKGSLVGTSSPRRKAQLLALRPDLCPVPLRGPVDDRIKQVRSGAIGGAVLALAGLERIGHTQEIAERFPIELFVPAPAQGALAVAVRSDDPEAQRLVAMLDDPPTRIATQAELAVLRPFERSARHALGAYALMNECLVLRARLLSLDGREVWDVVELGEKPEEVAAKAIERLALQTLPIT